MMSTRRNALFVLFALLFSTLCLAGCGKKVWPEAVIQEDTFAFSNVKGSLVNGQLTVTADITGNTSNVKRVFLELTNDADCPGCPFKVAKRFEFIPGTSGITLNKGALTIVQGDLGDGPFMWRLYGDNAQQSIEGVASDALVAP